MVSKKLLVKYLAIITTVLFERILIESDFAVTYLDCMQIDICATNR